LKNEKNIFEEMFMAEM